MEKNDQADGDRANDSSQYQSFVTDTLGIVLCGNAASRPKGRRSRARCTTPHPQLTQFPYQAVIPS